MEEQQHGHKQLEEEKGEKDVRRCRKRSSL